MEVVFVGVPEIELGGGGGSVVFGGGGGGGSSGGGEDWVVLKRNPFHFFFEHDRMPLC